MEALVAPFIGERYTDTDSMESLIAPPYDAIPPERRLLLASDPANVVNVTLPEGDDPYTAAASKLMDWRRSGVIARDPAPSVYVLRQTHSIEGQTFARTGVIAGVAAESYEAGRVRPHEKTHAHIKEDRLALLRSTGTMCESLFFLAPDDKGSLKAQLASVTAGPAHVKTRLDSVEIELWMVSGNNAADIADAAGQSHIYIADGHHRFETGRAYRNEHPSADRTLALIVPLGDPGLVVLPTHRIIKSGVADDASVREILEPLFDITGISGLEESQQSLHRSENTACVVALNNGSNLLCELKSGADLSEFEARMDATTAALDIARIDALVVDPLKGTASGTVSYRPDLAGVTEALAGGASAAVVVRPTGVDQVVKVADAGGVMPQKATYFVPKVPSGLVFLNLAARER